MDVLHLAIYFGAPRLVALTEAALAATLASPPAPNFGAPSRPTGGRKNLDGSDLDANCTIRLVRCSDHLLSNLDCENVVQPTAL